ncbi:MAG TPA: hypothetical protein VGG27_15470 [Magnetospirillaceae bacterium]|jgi:hypothetical protein
MYRALLFAGLFAAACLGSGAASSQPACPHGDQSDISKKDVAFARDMQQAMEHDDREWFADHTHYPMRYSFGAYQKTLFIRSRAEFLAKFDKLFIYNTIFAIRHTRPDCLLKEMGNVMMGDGEVWFGPFDAKGKPGTKVLLIVTIWTADQGL